MGIINDNNSENQVSQQRLIDQTGSGNVCFYRVFTFDAEDDGALLSVDDYDLDGNPYTVVGSVVCESDIVFNDAVAAGKINADGTVASIFNATVAKVSTGFYRVNFLTIQPSSNYPIMVSVEKTAGSDDIIAHYDAVTSSSFDVHVYEQDNGGGPGTPIDNAFSFFIPNLSGNIQSGASHSVLSGLGADDHPQYLNEARHDALPFDNPHNVTKSQVGLGNVPDVDATDRANHTGTQTASTISDFDTEVSNNTDVTANTAKISADGSIDTHSDVDTTSSAPNTGDLLQWDGSNWVPFNLIIKKNLLAFGTGIGSASAAANQSFNLDLSDGNYEIGDTIRIGAAYVRGDLSSIDEFISVGINSTADPKAELGVEGYEDSATFRTDGGLMDRTYSVVDIGSGVPGIIVYVSPEADVNFSPAGMPNGWFWQLKLDILEV